MNRNEILRNIPQVEKLLQEGDISALIPHVGQGIAADIVRDEVEKFRKSVIAGDSTDTASLKNGIISSLKKKITEKLQRVINGTGVIIHTNLGRAPLGEKVFNMLKENLSGYCNLEFHIPTRSRGKRGGFAEELICRLTGAEDALIVNNNASSVFLILKAFAEGGEVIVSRGELIQIGGGFRIPDIMKESGAVLVETGTTNITTIDDYRSAVTDRTRMIFSAHTSNYRIEGFTESPAMKELASMKSDDILYVRDLGSGNLTMPDGVEGDFEQTVFSEVLQGPDLVCFSGDKLLGGCQAGIIVGRRELVAKLRKHPLMRMIRVDKITYMILQQTLLEYANGNQSGVELRRLISQSSIEVKERALSFISAMESAGYGEYFTLQDTMATYGGGSMPGVELLSSGVAVSIPGVKPDEINGHFLSSVPPVTGRVREDCYIIDFFTIFERDIQYIVEASKALVAERN